MWVLWLFPSCSCAVKNPNRRWNNSSWSKLLKPQNINVCHASLHVDRVREIVQSLDLISKCWFKHYLLLLSCMHIQTHAIWTEIALKHRWKTLTLRMKIILFVSIAFSELVFCFRFVRFTQFENPSDTKVFFHFI